MSVPLFQSLLALTFFIHLLFLSVQDHLNYYFKKWIVTFYELQTFDFFNRNKYKFKQLIELLA